MYRLQNILHEENPCNTGQHIYEQRNVRKLRMLFSKFLSHSGITDVHCAKFHNMRDDCLLNRLVSSTCYSFHTHAWLSRWRTQAQSAGFKAASDVRNTLTLSAVFGWYLSSRSSLTFAQNIDGKFLTAAIYTAAVRRDLFLRENRIISAKKRRESQHPADAGSASNAAAASRHAPYLRQRTRQRSRRHRREIDSTPA